MGRVVLIYKYFLNHASIWCLEKDIQQFLKVVLLIFILMQNIEKHNISENHQIHHSLALSMGINYQAMTLRLGHYSITNQGKGSAALVRTIVFNDWGLWICLIKQKKEKSQKLKSLFSIF